MRADLLQAKVLVAGKAQGDVLFSDVPLSFWSGVDAITGVVIDQRHPLFGQSMVGKILVLPSGRGSCTGSAVMLQLLSSGKGPAAILICEKEEIITLGVVIAAKFFDTSIPVVRLSPEDFAQLAKWDFAVIDHGGVSRDDIGVGAEADVETHLNLSEVDRAMLAGVQGPAVQLAMEVIVSMADVYGAAELMDISQAHIDGCIYTGEAGLAFAERLATLGARVNVPTTLNAISVDRRRWRDLGVKREFGDASERLAEAYLAMGCQPSYTCAPYLLSGQPQAGDQVAWGESNAVIYANSVLGARTLKYPDYLDICIAITGRAPRAGTHTNEGRKPQLHIVVEEVQDPDDAFFALLGYHVGRLCGSRIPLITGLKPERVSADDLKTFSAALGTTSGAPMFHIAGFTGSPTDSAPLPHVVVSKADLQKTWISLNAGDQQRVDLVALGNPHFSADEFRRLAVLCAGKRKQPDVKVIVTCGRAIESEVTADGTLAMLENFGVTLLTDTCWCMIEKPIIPEDCRLIGTNSGKYVHYGPGIAGIQVRLGSLADCVQAAVTGLWPQRHPDWLR